jgi:hypothetical protein
MKIKNGEGLFIAYPESTVNFNSFFDLNGVTGDISQGRLKVIGRIKRRVNNRKDGLQDFWPVEKR